MEQTEKMTDGRTVVFSAKQVSANLGVPALIYHDLRCHRPSSNDLKQRIYMKPYTRSGLHGVVYEGHQRSSFLEPRKKPATRECVLQFRLVIILLYRNLWYGKYLSSTGVHCTIKLTSLLYIWYRHWRSFHSVINAAASVPVIKW